MSKYKLIIHTNEYTGNFHSELNAFVFGYTSSYEGHSWVDDLYKKAKKEFEGDDKLDIVYDLYDCIHDEYGDNISELSNYIDKKGTTSITVFFRKNPTEYIPIFIERLKKFPKELAKSWEFAPRNVKIISVELIEIVTQEKSLYKETL